MSDNITESTGEALTLPHERLMVCLEAAWELDAIARVLPDMVPRDGNNPQPHLLVRALADRVQRLASVLMSGLDDPLAPTAQLEQVISLEQGRE
jgi:hypothetical protein